MKKLFAVLSALVVFAAAQPVMAHSTQTNVAKTTSAVNMRTCASTHCHRITTLPAWTSVRVLGCNYNWCKVAHHGRVGYVSAGYLRVDNPRHRHNDYRPNRYPRRPYNSGVSYGGSVNLSGNDALGIAAALAAGYIIYQAIND